MINSSRYNTDRAGNQTMDTKRQKAALAEITENINFQKTKNTSAPVKFYGPSMHAQNIDIGK